ncbi:hypothetical protein ISX56_34570, partial [Serratia ureilytica]|nr:hypothetical protein [Serratia ureilytica]
MRPQPCSVMLCSLGATALTPVFSCAAAMLALSWKPFFRHQPLMQGPELLRVLLASEYDELTGLPNRRLFKKKAEAR